MNEKTIQVSDEFIHLYKMFPVVKITDEMKNLSRKELLLLLILAADSYSETNPVILFNCKEFKEDLKVIYKLQELDPSQEANILNTDPTLLELGELTGEKYINVSQIRDTKGNQLPAPTTDQEAIQIRRDIGINTIIE